MTTPLDHARADLGLSSAGFPRFHGPPFTRYALPGEQPLAWCARACRSWFVDAGSSLPGDEYAIASVANLHAAFAAAGMLLPPSAEPRANDLIFLEGTQGNRDGLLIGGHHVGLVESASQSLVVSIDGDWGTPDRVQRVTRDRSASDIWGYGRVALLSSSFGLGKAVAIFLGVRAARALWRRHKGGA